MIKKLCILLLCCMCGCGTVANIAFGAPGTNNGFMGLEPKPYGGVQWDLHVCWRHLWPDMPIAELAAVSWLAAHAEGDLQIYGDCG